MARQITHELDLNILNRFEQLMQKAIDSESVYIRTKETLEALFERSTISDKEKAEALSAVLGSMTTGITTAAMQSALQWASTEEDLLLKRAELEKSLDNMDVDKKLKEAQVNKLMYECIALQADTLANYGINASDVTVSNTAPWKFTAGAEIKDNSKAAKEMLILGKEADIKEQQATNLGEEEKLLQLRQGESKAQQYKTAVDAIANYGTYSYSWSGTGDTGLSLDITARNVNNPLGTDYKALVEYQAAIAKEQANGYAYNAWANAATGSAGMVGTVEASGSNQTPTYEFAMEKFKDSLTSLANIIQPFP